MDILIRSASLLLFSISLLAHGDAKTPNVSQIPIEDFVKLPTMQNAQISPNGKHLSVKFRKNGVDMLAILDAKTRKIKNAFRVRGQNRSVGNVHWINNERLLYSVQESHVWDKTLRSTGELIGVNVDGSNHKLIFGYQAGESQTGTRLIKKKSSYGSHEIIDLLPDDKKNILIVFYPWKLEGRYWVTNYDVSARVLKLNVYNGKLRPHIGLPLPLAQAITDTKSRVRFAIGKDKQNFTQVFYRDISGKKWKKFAINNFKGKGIRPVSFTETNQEVYFTADINGGTRALYLLSLKDHSIKKIYHHPKVDISLFIRNYDKNKVVAVGTDLALPQYHYLDKKDPKAKIHKTLMKAFKGFDIFITSVTDKKDKIIVRAYSDFDSSSYYLFDTATMKADFLFAELGWLDNSKTASTISKEFKTRDGKIIYGYLTLPPKQTSNLPLVVMPHGGPHGVRDYWGYDWEVQLLANRGYAVLQVNYRGSSGYGRDFEITGHGNWGTLMQDDITDATQALIDEKVANAKRICIFGASYGGYAALMGAAREPNLYRCAIGSMGVYDLPMMFEEGDIAEKQRGLAYLYDVLGDDINDQKQRSPVYNVDKIKADILLIHGGQDQRAPIEQAEALKNAFDKIGKKYEWLELKNQGHGYYDEQSRLIVYKKVLNFLQKNIGHKKL